MFDFPVVLANYAVMLLKELPVGPGFLVIKSKLLCLATKVNARLPISMASSFNLSLMESLFMLLLREIDLLLPLGCGLSTSL